MISTFGNKFSREEHTPMFKVEVSKISHTISRIIITTLQRTESSLKIFENEKHLLNSILQISMNLLNSSEVPLDTRTNFGFVIVLILECLQGPHGWMKVGITFSLSKQKNSSWKFLIIILTFNVTYIINDLCILEVTEN